MKARLLAVLVPVAASGLMRILMPLVRRVAHRERIGGFQVLFCTNAADRKWLSERILEAVDILDQFDPVRLGRIRRDIREIGVVETRARISGSYGAGLCWLSADALRQHPTEASLRAAVTLVHEATHARLARHGSGALRRLTKPRRLRVERLCIEAQCTFLSRVPSDESQQAVFAAAARQIAEVDSVYSDRAIVERMR